jgi:signal peptidase I
MTEQVKKRHPAVAALLSLLLMGLGQLYNGQLRRAVVFFTLDILVAVLVATNSTFLLSFHGVMIIYFAGLIFVGIRLFAVIDAFIGARKIGALELQRYNRWYVYASVIFAAGIIQIVFENPVKTYSIPSGSSQPTLLVGDYVVANKTAYHDQAPERGDVVVFMHPKDNQTEYIKRIVGLPGDNIQVLGGILQIDGKPVGRKKLGDVKCQSYGGYDRQAVEYAETLPNGVEHRIWETSDENMLDNTPVYQVPPGHYFMMGDNRDRSADSRVSAMGFVPAVNLVSRVDVLWFSQNGTASWWQIWRWPQAIRFDRIGKEIH